MKVREQRDRQRERKNEDGLTIIHINHIIAVSDNSSLLLQSLE
jgi:hypothetical protein